MSSAVDSMKKVAMFADVPEKLLQRLERMARERSYNAGDDIIKQGEEGAGVFVVLEGEAEALRDGQSLATLGPGTFFGEMAFLDHYRRSATVRAKTATKCLAIPRSDFVAEVKGNPELCFNMLVYMTRRVRDLDARLASE
jgi:CRP-like cAMP-binding protein